MAAAPTHRFVIRPLAEAAAAAALPSELKATKLASAKGGWRVETAGRTSEHAAWKALQRRLAPAWRVIPVMDGSDGIERYPTGHISVRFGSTVSDATLAGLSKSSGLQLIQRTKFSDRQAVFAASDPGAYLPELVERAAKHADVEAAWLDAESAYRRSP